MKDQNGPPKLSVPPLEVQDTARQPLRYGDGFISDHRPPMLKKGK